MAATLTCGDVDLRNNGTSLINVRRSKTGPDAEGVTLYIGPQAGGALRAIRPAAELLDRKTPVFGLSPRQIGRRVNAATIAAGLGDGLTGYSGGVGMAQDLAAAGVELPALMTAGRWKISKMPARYTEGRQRAGGRWPGITRAGGLDLRQKGRRSNTMFRLNCSYCRFSQGRMSTTPSSRSVLEFIRGISPLLALFQLLTCRTTW